MLYQFDMKSGRIALQNGAMEESVVAGETRCTFFFMARTLAPHRYLLDLHRVVDVSDCPFIAARWS